MSFIKTGILKFPFLVLIIEYFISCPCVYCKSLHQNTSIFSDTTICSDTFKILNQPSLSVYKGYWKFLERKGIFFPDSSSFTATVYNLKQGEKNSLVWIYRDSTNFQRSDTLYIKNLGASPAIILSRSPAGLDNICKYTDTLRAAEVKYGTGSWSVNNKAAILRPDLRNTAISNLPIGSTIVTWTVINGKCKTSTSDTVFNKLPPVPDAGADKIVCVNAVSLFAKKPASGIGQWRSINSSTSVSFDDKNSETSFVRQLNYGLNTFTWNITSSGCDTMLSDTIKINYAAPSPAEIIRPASGTEICSESITLTCKPLEQGQGMWLRSDAAAYSINLLTPTAVRVTNLALNNNYIILAVTNGNICPASIDTILIKNSLPSKALAYNKLDTHTCKSYIKLWGVKPKQGNGSWRDLRGDISYNDTVTVFNLKSDTNIFIRKVSWSYCPASEVKLVVVNDLPPKFNAGEDLTTCKDTVQLHASMPSSGLYSANWVPKNDIPSILINSYFDPNALVRGLPKDTTYFYWKVAHLYNNKCPFAMDTVRVINNTPSKAKILSSISDFCQDSTTVNVVTPDEGKGSWVFSAPGIITKSNKSGTVIKNIPPGKNTCIWTVTKGTCISHDSIVITNNKLRNFSAGKDNSTCLVADTLRGTDFKSVFPGATARWTIISEPPGNEKKTLINDKLAPVTLINKMVQAGMYEFEWQVTTAPGCILKDTVKIKRDEFSKAILIDDQGVLCGTRIKLKAKAVTIGRGRWKLLTGGGNILNPDSNETYINDLIPDFNNSFQWTTMNGACKDQVTITVPTYLPSTKASIISKGLTNVCDADRITLIANGADTTRTHEKATWFYNGKDLNTKDNKLVYSPLNYAPLKNIFIRRIMNGQCPPSYDTLIINNYPNAPLPEIKLAQRSTCDPNISFNITISGKADSYFWTSLDSNHGISPPVVNGANQYFLQNLKPGRYSYLFSVKKGLCINSDTLTFTINDIPSAPKIIKTLIDTAICETANNTYTLIAEKPLAGSYGRWKTGNTSTPFPSINTRPDSAVVEVKLVNGRNKFIWETSKSGDCSLQDTIIIQVDKKPEAANAGPDRTVYEATGNLSGISPGAANKGIAFWKVLKGSIELIDPSQADSPFLKLGMGRNILVWNVTNGICPSMTDTVIIERIPFEISKGLSPNGDGINDTLIIKGIQEYFPRELFIYNRWGTEVYKNIEYNNTWQGESNEGEALPEGTYFYLLKLRSEKIVNGFIIIKRR